MSFHKALLRNDASKSHYFLFFQIILFITFFAMKMAMMGGYDKLRMFTCRVKIFL